MAIDLPMVILRVSNLARAKINLYLHIVGRYQNGYHQLDSLIVFSDIADEVVVESADYFSLNLEGPFHGPLKNINSKENLVVKALKLLAGVCGRSENVCITLRKNLPVASGLGGGSADAAATLLGLIKLWEIRISKNELYTLAARLGADVPACLNVAPIQVGGVGDDIENAPKLPPAWIVLVNPGVTLLTERVFQVNNKPSSGVSRIHQPLSDIFALARVLKKRSNDLQGVATEIVPMIGNVISLLANSDGCLLARMSGSGATCFGLFQDEASALAAQIKIASVQTNWWVQTGRMLVADNK